jgi:hypothetical protein
MGERMKHVGRTLAVVGVCLALTPSASHADPNMDQLKKLYDDTLVQLREAQDRKNELAVENQALRTKLNELQTQVDQTQLLRDDLAAWDVVAIRHPELRGIWLRNRSPIYAGVRHDSAWHDPRWPFSSVQPATMPTGTAEGKP